MLQVPLGTSEYLSKHGRFTVRTCYYHILGMDGAHPSQWLFPSGSHIKVNCDVGYISSDFYQMAAVARNAEGVCVWWRVSKLVGQPPAALGERLD